MFSLQMEFKTKQDLLDFLLVPGQAAEKTAPCAASAKSLEEKLATAEAVVAPKEPGKRGPKPKGSPEAAAHADKVAAKPMAEADFLMGLKKWVDTDKKGNSAKLVAKMKEFGVENAVSLPPEKRKEFFAALVPAESKEIDTDALFGDVADEGEEAEAA